MAIEKWIDTNVDEIAEGFLWGLIRWDKDRPDSKGVRNGRLKWVSFEDIPDRVVQGAKDHLRRILAEFDLHKVPYDSFIETELYEFGEMLFQVGHTFHRSYLDEPGWAFYGPRFKRAVEYLAGGKWFYLLDDYEYGK